MDRRLMNTTWLQSRITELHGLHKRTVSDYGELVESLNAECDVFVDCIPQYKISAEVADDGQKKKEVASIEKLERVLLTQYEHFLDLLRRLERKVHPEEQALGCRLVCRLLPVAHEFNHNERLMRLAVAFANSRSSRVAQPALKALQELLDGELVSEATQFTVNAILDIVRREKHALNPKLLTVLLAIRVAMIDVHKKDVTEEKAKEKRQKKEDKELARQMQKTKARRDRAELAARQTKILHNVFVIYLRILEASRTCAASHQARILAPTLEGLAKFAQLVNLEHHRLLMQALKDLLQDENTGVATRLHALVAVAALAEKQVATDSNEWRIDLSFFHNILFCSITEALRPPVAEKSTAAEDEADSSDTASNASTTTVGTLSSLAFSIADSMAQQRFTQQHAIKEWTYRSGLVIRAIDLLILTQKHLPASRVMAVFRRVHQFVHLCPPHIGMALLALCHRLVRRYPSCAGLLIGGADYAVGGRGVYDPCSEDVHATYADAAFAWEMSLTRKSYHPTFSEVSAQFIDHYHRLSKLKNGAPPPQSRALDQLGPYEVLERFDSSEGNIVPEPNAKSSLAKSLAGRKRAREE